MWSKIEDEGIILKAYRSLSPEEGQRNGSFRPNFKDTGSSRIVVFRRRRQDVVDDFEQELYTLAHEYGHAISFRKDQRPWKSAPPTTPDLAPETKQEVLEEEARAWRYGEEILRELGVDDLNAYVERQEKSIEEYRRRLGLV